MAYDCSILLGYSSSCVPGMILKAHSMPCESWHYSVPYKGWCFFTLGDGWPFGTGGSRYGPGMTYHKKQHKSHHRLFVATTSQETYDFLWPVDLWRLKDCQNGGGCLKCQDLWRNLFCHETIAVLIGIERLLWEIFIFTPPCESTDLPSNINIHKVTFVFQSSKVTFRKDMEDWPKNSQWMPNLSSSMLLS